MNLYHHLPLKGVLALERLKLHILRNALQRSKSEEHRERVLALIKKQEQEVRSYESRI